MQPSVRSFAALLALTETCRSRVQPCSFKALTIYWPLLKVGERFSDEVRLFALESGKDPEQFRGTIPRGGTVLVRTEPPHNEAKKKAGGRATSTGSRGVSGDFGQLSVIHHCLVARFSPFLTCRRQECASTEQPGVVDQLDHQGVWAIHHATDVVPTNLEIYLSATSNSDGSTVHSSAPSFSKSKSFTWSGSRSR
jgi:hypothetical protein